ncbi:MAG: zinc-ribbon domain-containing protein [Alphaproteobacteria bacterium]
MIVSCPSCATRYLIDPTALGGEGRTVRCAKCSHTWHERPPADMPKRVDILPPDDAPRPIPFGSNLPAIVARRRRANRLGWLAVAAAVIIIIVAGIVARGPIVDAWPPAGKLYTAIGLGVDKIDTAGLEIQNVVQEQMVEGGVQILVIRGKIQNLADHSRTVPPIRISLLDAADIELHHWTFAAEQSELEAESHTNFETRLNSPPRGAVSLQIKFAGDEAN